MRNTRGRWRGLYFNNIPPKILLATSLKKERKKGKRTNRLNSICMWPKHDNNNPLPWSFQGYKQQPLTVFTLFLRVCFCNHPTDTTPTMESWSKSSRRDKLVLWSQEYFRLMESWRFLKNDSRSRASLKNCGDGREGCLVLNMSQHQDLNWARTILLCRAEQSWSLSPGLVMVHYKDHRSINWRFYNAMTGKC